MERRRESRTRECEQQTKQKVTNNKRFTLQAPHDPFQNGCQRVIFQVMFGIYTSNSCAVSTRADSDLRKRMQNNRTHHVISGTCRSPARLNTFQLRSMAESLSWTLIYFLYLFLMLCVFVPRQMMAQFNLNNVNLFVFMLQILITKVVKTEKRPHLK